MVVIARIDLDKVSLSQIEDLVRNGIVSLPDARESKAVKSMGEYDQVLWYRKMSSK